MNALATSFSNKSNSVRDLGGMLLMSDVCTSFSAVANRYNHSLCVDSNVNLQKNFFHCTRVCEMFKDVFDRSSIMHDF